MFRREPRCIFCGNKELTHEHIYPRWLFNYLQAPELNFRPGNANIVIASTSKNENIVTVTQFRDNREIPYQNFKSRIVCRGCNGGWMSDLENSVQSIFENIFNTSLNTLSAQEAYLLSKWSILKIILIGKTAETKFHFDPFILNLLRQGIIPEGFLVEIRRMETNFLNYQLGSSPAMFANKVTQEQLTLAAENFLVAGLHIGNIGIRVSFFRTSIPLQRIQVNEPMLILYPFLSNLPMIEVKVHEDSTVVTSETELTGMCNCLTICDSI